LVICHKLALCTRSETRLLLASINVLVGAHKTLRQTSLNQLTKSIEETQVGAVNPECKDEGIDKKTKLRGVQRGSVSLYTLT
jgi:hypothetical protein